MIAFIGSVFSPYYHWSGRSDPANHVAFNVALYGPGINGWAMTERGRGELCRDAQGVQIGPSHFRFDGTGFDLAFDEVFLPWPGQRLLPKRMSGRIRLEPRFLTETVYELEAQGGHQWFPIAPSGRVRFECDGLAAGGWSGEGYHDRNWGSRPLERDFRGWDWARGRDAGRGESGPSVLVYDAELADGSPRRFGLRFQPDGACERFALPVRHALARGFWGVGGGVACDAGSSPSRLLRVLEDSPFYRRSLVSTRLCGEEITMVHESLDCRRLAMPLVRLMLPFRMPRRG